MGLPTISVKNSKDARRRYVPQVQDHFHALLEHAVRNFGHFPFNAGFPTYDVALSRCLAALHVPLFDLGEAWGGDFRAPPWSSRQERQERDDNRFRWRDAPSAVGDRIRRPAVWHHLNGSDFLQLKYWYDLLRLK